MPKPVMLITGGSRGIGAACVKTFQKEGWTVAACSSKSTSTWQCEPDLKFTCDVSRPDQVRDGITQTLKNLSRIDVLINNAGLSGDNSLDPNSSDELWHRIIDVNLHGTYYFSKYCLPHLPDQTGRIINIGSVLSLKGVPGATAYCAAKHAVAGFTKALAHDVGSRKITVNAICPGWTRTEMGESRMKEIGMKEEDLKKGVPLGRWVEPEEVARLAFYLASEAARSITGQTFVIDSGALA